MNNFKKVLIVGMSLSVLFGARMNVQAEGPKKYSINSMEKLEKKVLNLRKMDSLKNTGKLREEIYENTNPQILQTYINKSKKDIEETTKSLVEELESSNDGLKVSMEDSHDYLHKTLSGTTSKGDEVTVELTDEPEKTLKDTSVIVPFISGGSSMFKDFGARRYTIHVQYRELLWDNPDLCLVMHYTIGKSGLVLTSADKAGTKGFFPVSITASVKETDKKAEKEGYDINAKGEYNLTWIGKNGVGLGSNDITITGTVKLLNLFPSDGYAYVKQSFSTNNDDHLVGL